MISLMAAAAMMLIAAEPAQAAAPAQPQAQDPAQTRTTVAGVDVEAQPRKPRPDEVVCKKEHLLGSRLPKRTCSVQAEWVERKDDDRAAVERNQTNLQGYR